MTGRRSCSCTAGRCTAGCSRRSCLRSRGSIASHAVDLPGHGHSDALRPWTLEAVVESLERRFANAAALSVLGWSLGGAVALAWARRVPSRISRLVLVATTPKFIAAGDWPHAMTEETLVRFADELRVAFKPTLLRFLTLQVQGSDEGRATLAALRHQLFSRGEPDPAMLADALASLRAIDLRDDVAPHPPAVAGRDRRARHAGAAAKPAPGSRRRCRPAACIRSRALRTRRSCRTATHSSRSHCRSCAWLIRRTRRPIPRRRPGRGQARVRPRGRELRRGRRPAARSRFADAVAPRRRQARADGDPRCGLRDRRGQSRARGALSGRADRRLRFRASDGHAARERVRRSRSLYQRLLAPIARVRGAGPQFVCADLNALPFAGVTFDLAWSNLTLQWVNDLPRAFAEMRRVPDGRRAVHVHDVRAGHAEGAARGVRARGQRPQGIRT